MDAGMTMSVMHFEMWWLFDRRITVGGPAVAVAVSVWVNLVVSAASCLNHCGDPSLGVTKRTCFVLTLTLFLWLASPQSCGLHSM